jgi:hypothetical protein
MNEHIKLLRYTVRYFDGDLYYPSSFPPDSSCRYMEYNQYVNLTAPLLPLLDFM